MLFCSVFYARAQSFMKGEVSVNAGVGLGVLMNELSGVYTYSPPLSVSAEYSMLCEASFHQSHQRFLCNSKIAARPGSLRNG